MEPASALVVIVHGAGEHSGRYRDLAEHFNRQGYSVAAWDSRGHGQSPGQRGFIRRWRDLRGDLHYFLMAARRETPGVPVFLLGHSLGGAITLDYLLHYRNRDVAAYICSAPAIGKLGIPPVLLKLARVLNHSLPRLGMNTGLNIEDISRDPEWREHTRRDPLYHRRGTPRLGMELQKTVDNIHRRAHTLDCPTLLIHGEADRICSIDGSRKLAEAIPRETLTFHRYPGGYHELFNDLGRDGVIDDVDRWLNSQL
ncbi:MAG: alpha/beta hydrolase [Pseudomonadota bacterium]